MERLVGQKEKISWLPSTLVAFSGFVRPIFAGGKRHFGEVVCRTDERYIRATSILLALFVLDQKIILLEIH